MTSPRPLRVPSRVAETKRLVLRRFTTSDAAFALRLLNEPSFIENIADRGVRTLEQAARYLLEGPIASYQRHGHGLYLVELKPSLQPIGMCGVLKRAGFPDVDLGYAFLPEFWSQGFAFESASAVLDLVRSVLRLPRIVAFVSMGNATSIRLLRKLGFSHAGETNLEPASGIVSLFELELQET
jgi:[ribosomal protein S5]-alanine N-acetyltransferase